VVREGNDVTLICTGGILSEVISAAEQLAPQIQECVLSMPTLKPIDGEFLSNAVGKPRLLVTVEKHLAGGGLGSAVVQTLNAFGGTEKHECLILSSTEAPWSTMGSQDSLRQSFGLDAASIARTVRERFSQLRKA
jgi:transketolase